MSRITLTNPDHTSGQHKTTFDEIHGAFGTVPNMFKAIGTSSAALESMWTSFKALGKGTLDPKLTEQLAVHIADLNRCQYCLSAHTVLGTNAGATAEEMASAQGGESNDPKTQAALNFARKMVTERGMLSSLDVDQIRAAGFSDEQIAELLAHVTLNIFTNYTNVVFDVPVDFPLVPLR